MIRLFTLSAIFLFNIFQVKGQGSWNPGRADLSYPRTLLDRNDITAVRTSIQAGVRKEIYSNIYKEVMGEVPTDPNPNQQRRLYATYAKNTAFVILMNQRSDGGNLSNLLPQERNTLLTKAKNLLEQINTSISQSNYTEWQWRSKELIDYMVAYDLLRGAGEPPGTLLAGRNKLQEFAGNLHQVSTFTIGIINFYSAFPNHNALMTAAALGLSAVVLNDATSTNSHKQPDNWINTGMYHLDHILWRDNNNRQSDPNVIAGYAEGPYYFKDAFLNVLPFIRAMGNFLPSNYSANYGSSRQPILNPYFDPSYDLLYQWITDIAMPDGRFPALEDSYISMGMPELALTGKSQYVLPLKLDNLNSEQINTMDRQLGEYGYTNVDMRAAYLAANIEPTTPQYKTLTVLPQSGNLVFRSGSDPLATYLHVYGKNGLAQTNTGSTNHADASSFILQAQGQLLALDPGFIYAGHTPSLSGAANHNVILVDDTAPNVPAFIRNTFNTTNLAYGEVQTEYNGASITRKTVFIRNTHFLMADFISSNSPKNYTWQLHGYGLENGRDMSKNDPGIFTDRLAQQQGIWRKNGVSLQAHVTATGSVAASGYTKALGIHELGYDKTENHTTLLVKKNGANTQFLSVLYPFTSTPATVTTTSSSNTASLTATESGYKDIAFTQTNPVSTTYNNSILPKSVTSDGLLTFFSLDNTNVFAQLLVDQGMALNYGNTVFLRSTNRANVNWARVDEETYEGYVSRDTKLQLALPFPPTQVLINGVSTNNYKYLPESGLVEIDFSGAANFEVNAKEPLPVELLSFKAARQNHLVKLNWQTATETQNAGFAILRKAEGEKEFTQIGFVPGHGNSIQVKNYSYEDKNAPAVITYYQLKQVDIDGQSHLSPVVAVPGLKYTASTLLVAPVPADRYLWVTLLGTKKEAKLRLTSVDGKVVLEQKFQNQVTLEVGALSAGIYYLQALDVNGQAIAPGKKIVINH